MNKKERAEKVLQKMYGNDRFSKWMAIEIVHIDEGECTLKMKVRDDMLNGFDILHGGISYSLADSALAFASNSYGVISVSLSVTMSYPASATAGDELTATAIPVSITKRTGIFDITITKQTGETVGLFRGTVYRTGKEWEGI